MTQGWKKPRVRSPHFLLEVRVTYSNGYNPSFFDVSGPKFGEITNTVGTPRLIQFAFRYSF